MKKKGVAVVVILLLGAAAAGGGYWYVNYYNKGAAPGELVSSDSENAVYVDSVAVIAGLGSGNGLLDRYSGVVEPQETWECKVSSDKKIKECYVEVGQEVKVGDKLFSYDTTDDEDKLAQLEIEIERTQNEIETTKNQITQLEKEKEKANEDDKLRYTTEILTAENTIKRDEYDLKSKNVELEQLKETIKNSTVNCELAGMVRSISDPNNSSDMGMGAGSSESSAYITVIATGAYRVKGKINEQNRYNISEGSPMLVHSRLNDGATWTGTLTKIDWDNAITNDSSGGYVVYGGSGGGASDSSSNYPFYVELENSDGLILGQHVYMEANVGQEEEKDGIWIESYYLEVGEDGADSFAWAANDDGLLEKRKVTLGEYDEDLMKYEILDGLDEEDYIAFPTDTLEEGLPVVYNTGNSATDMDLTGGLMSPENFDDGSFEDMPMDDSFSDDMSLPEGSYEELPMEDGLGDDMSLPEGSYEELPMEDGLGDDMSLPLDDSGPIVDGPGGDDAMVSEIGPGGDGATVSEIGPGGIG